MNEVPSRRDGSPSVPELEAALGRVRDARARRFARVEIVVMAALVVATVAMAALIFVADLRPPTVLVVLLGLCWVAVAARGIPVGKA